MLHICHSLTEHSAVLKGAQLTAVAHMQICAAKGQGKKRAAQQAGQAQVIS